jgi:hypothetical protein
MKKYEAPNETGRPVSLTLAGAIVEERKVEDVVRTHSDDIMKIPGVIGVGVGLSRSGSRKKCIVVYARSPGWPDALPRELDGYSVEIVVRRGGFRAL